MDITKLGEQLGKFTDMPNQLPPVDSWNPELSGDIDIVIDESCRWFHEGDEIKREKLVRIFSTILKKEGDEYFLVTPVEKWRITVMDTPFEVVLAQAKHSNKAEPVIEMITNVGDDIILDGSNQLQLKPDGLPQVKVRGNLMARLGRNVYYQLAELAKEEQGAYVVESGGVKHVLSNG